MTCFNAILLYILFLDPTQMWTHVNVILSVCLRSTAGWGRSGWPAILRALPLWCTLTRKMLTVLLKRLMACKCVYFVAVFGLWVRLVLFSSYIICSTWFICLVFTALRPNLLIIPVIPIDKLSITSFEKWWNLGNQTSNLTYVTTLFAAQLATAASKWPKPGHGCGEAGWEVAMTPTCAAISVVNSVTSPAIVLTPSLATSGLPHHQGKLFPLLCFSWRSLAPLCIVSLGR